MAPRRGCRAGPDAPVSRIASAPRATPTSRRGSATCQVPRPVPAAAAASVEKVPGRPPPDALAALAPRFTPAMLPAQLNPCETRFPATVTYAAMSVFQIEAAVRCPMLSGTRNSPTKIAAAATSTPTVEALRASDGTRTRTCWRHPTTTSATATQATKIGRPPSIPVLAYRSQYHENTCRTPSPTRGDARASEMGGEAGRTSNQIGAPINASAA